MATDSVLERRYREAQDAYAAWGVDTEQALAKLARIPISLHCWQGDDVAGFEGAGGITGGGILSTGNYPGRARTPDELRADLEQTFRMVPGKHRVNLHAIYGDFRGRKADRDAIGVEHFQGWIDWAKAQGLGLDFNPSLFSHPKANAGFTLTSLDPAIRQFWIEHCQRSRQIAVAMGTQLKNPCVNNIWIPDGYKDVPVDRARHRALLKESLDAIFAEQLPATYLRDALEPKLFGIGSESCTFGSLEFYLGYAVQRQILLCLDSGHYHPTEVISDKLSSVLLFTPEVLLHVSRGIRWDSDHVVILADELVAIAQEVVRGAYGDRIHIGLDFFDGTLNRVAAWTIGTRSMLKALLCALLENTAALRQLETSGDYTGRLAILEEQKSLPWQAVWDYYCLRHEAPVGRAWLDAVRSYEKNVQFKRQ